MTLAERFWSKVEKGDPLECWEWTAFTLDDRGGYGQFRVGGASGAMIGAHRVAWELVNGEIPDGMCILHSCDNPPCVNPGHLFLGTKTDNAEDRDQKGRTQKGDDHAMAKITSDDVIEIREGFARGEKQEHLASRFGVSRSNVSLILARKTWKHVA